MIKTINLGRYFGENKAVDGISFEVAKGEVLGFLGPNGAGKSTTMKMLTCFLTPSVGTAKIGNYDIIENSREVRKLIGYLPENAPLYGEMTVKDFLNFVGQVRQIPQSQMQTAIDRVLGLTSLENVFSQRIETLSKGFKRRVGLAQALLHDPEVLILDEPTDGLDPNQKHEVRQLIRAMAKEKCIILSTHILEEVDEVCTRAIIIAKGRIVADSSPEELRKKSLRSGAITISFTKEPQADMQKILRGIAGVRAVEEMRTSAGRKSFILFPEANQNLVVSVVKESEKHGWQLADLNLNAGHLDDVFRALTQS